MAAIASKPPRPLNDTRASLFSLPNEIKTPISSFPPVTDVCAYVQRLGRNRGFGAVQGRTLRIAAISGRYGQVEAGQLAAVKYITHINISLGDMNSREISSVDHYCN